MNSKGDKQIRYCKKCEKDTMQRHEGRRENDWRCLEHGSASPKGQRNKRSIIARKVFKSIIREYLSVDGKCSHPGCDCEAEYCDIHHEDGVEKTADVTRMIENMTLTGKGNGYTVEQIWEEVDNKCVLLCSKHHAMKHRTYRHKEMLELFDEFPELHRKSDE